MALDHENIDDFGLADVFELWDTCIVQGTITDIDRDNNLADVTTGEFGALAGVPIHYHCENEDNVDEGHRAFAIGNVVKVFAVNARGRAIPAKSYVVGHSSGEMQRCIQKKYVLLEIKADREAIAPSLPPGAGVGVTYYTMFDLVEDKVADTIPDGLGGVITFPITDINDLNYWKALPNVGGVAPTVIWTPTPSDVCPTFGTPLNDTEYSPARLTFSNESTCNDTDKTGCATGNVNISGTWGGASPEPCPAFESEYGLSPIGVWDQTVYACSRLPIGGLGFWEVLHDETREYLRRGLFGFEMTNPSWGTSFYAVRHAAEQLDTATYHKICNQSNPGMGDLWFRCQEIQVSETGLVDMTHYEMWAPIAGGISLDLMSLHGNIWTFVYDGSGYSPDRNSPCWPPTTNVGNLTKDVLRAKNATNWLLSLESDQWNDGRATRLVVCQHVTHHEEVDQARTYPTNFEEYNTAPPGGTLTFVHRSLCGVKEDEDLTEDPRLITRSTNLEDEMHALFLLSSAGFGPAYQQISTTKVWPQRVNLTGTGQLWEEV